VNIGASWPTLEDAEARVLRMQTKLHQWAVNDPDRQFDDLFNLVYDPAVLMVAWRRVRGNRGKRSGGIDGVAPVDVTDVAGFLAGLRDDLKKQRFRPLPARERMIPKAGGKMRRLGIATATDRTAQAALKLVLEPIFEADFRPCSYGFRPKRRAQDAIAEIHKQTVSKTVVAGRLTGADIDGLPDRAFSLHLPEGRMRKRFRAASLDLDSVKVWGGVCG
jgi:RNA-directed DNA polymerase